MLKEIAKFLGYVIGGVLFIPAFIIFIYWPLGLIAWLHLSENYIGPMMLLWIGALFGAGFYFSIKYDNDK